MDVRRDTNHYGVFDLKDHEIRNSILQQAGSDPTGIEGKFFERSDTKKFRVYLNGGWRDMATMDDVTAGGISQSIVNAKGDLIVATADDTVARKAAGANNTFLTADSAQGDGLAYRLIVASDIDELIATTDLTDWPRVAALDLNSQKLTSVADGSAAQDAATYGQLLAMVEGKKWKDPVRAAVTTNVTLATAVENGDSLGGVTLATGDRIALLGQTTTTEDGIYTVNASGAPTRALDASTGAEITKATVIVTEGTLAGKQYTQVNTVSNIAADAQSWTLTGDSAAYVADESTLTLSGHTFSIKAGGVGATQLGTDAVTAIKMADASVDLATATVTGVLPTANGGTGSGTLSTARDNLAGGGGLTLPRKYAAALTGGAQTEVVTHGLGTRDVVVAVYVNGSTYPEDGFDVFHTSTTTITVGVASGDTIAAGTYRVVVIG